MSILKITGVKPGQEANADLIVLLFVGMKDPSQSTEKVRVQVKTNKGEKQVLSLNLEDQDTKAFLCSEFAAPYIKAYGEGNGLEKAVQEYKKTGKLGEVEAGTSKMLMTQLILNNIENTFEFSSNVALDLNSDEGWDKALETVVTPVNYYVAAVTAPTVAETTETTSEEAAATTPPVSAPPAVGNVGTPATETPAPTSEVALPVTSTPSSIAVANQEVFSNLLGFVAASQKAQQQTMEALLKQMQATNQIVEGLHQILTPTVVAEQQA